MLSAVEDRFLRQERALLELATARWRRSRGMSDVNMFATRSSA